MDQGLVERVEYSRRDVRYSITALSERVLGQIASLNDLLSQE